MLNIVQHKKVIHQNQGSNDPKGHKVDLIWATRAHKMPNLSMYNFMVWILINFRCENYMGVNGIVVYLARAGRWQDAKVGPAMKLTSVLTSEGLFLGCLI